MLNDNILVSDVSEATMNRILVADPIDTEGIALLQEHAEVDVRLKLSEAELISLIPAYDALVVRSETKVTAPILDAGERLKVVGRAGVGIDNIDVEAATRRGIVVVNAPTGNTIAAAEHTIALMMALARHIPQANATLRNGGWDRNKFIGTEVRGKTLGVIGLGRIGQEVARRADGLAMQVMAYDPFVAEDVAERLGVILVDLPDLLRQSDFVTLHTVLNDDTRGLIGTQAIEQMKPGARLINVARGGLVDEKALLAALDSGRLAGAALDVFAQEPLPADHPFRQHPKIVTTPHLGASTVEAQVGVARDVAEQIVAVLSGRPAEHAVNAPLVSPETLDFLVPYLDLAERLARFYRQVAGGRLSRVRLTYSGELADYDTTPLKAAVVRGLLGGLSEERINLVNAALIARRRGIEVIEEKTPYVKQFTSLVTIEATTSQGVQSVAGTVARGEAHLVRINDFWVDIVLEGSVLVSHNRDKPGVIGAVGSMLGQANVNIAYMQVGRDHPRGEAIMILGLDDPLPDGALEMLENSGLIYGVRLVQV
ncbi:MAG: phosphoglycerate dehydrogenase [Anaerolineae bacterium]